MTFPHVDEHGLSSFEQDKSIVTSPKYHTEISGWPANLSDSVVYIYRLVINNTYINLNQSPQIITFFLLGRHAQTTNFALGYNSVLIVTRYFINGLFRE